MSNLPKVIIYSSQEPNQSSYIQTGILELNSSGLAEFKINYTAKLNRGRYCVKNESLLYSDHIQPKTSFYKIITSDKRTIRFAIDLYDIPYYFSSIALNECDFVFKRNYESKYLNNFDEHLKKKIYPLGLTFPVLSSMKQKNVMHFFALILLGLREIKFEKNYLAKANKAIIRIRKQWKYVDKDRLISNFRSFNNDAESVVLFQTRCFERISDPDVFQLNNERAELIRSLNKKLNGQFRGGLISNEISVKYFSDCLSNIPSSQADYLKVVKKAGIVIYTRGLKNSPAWKLAEYLSQGKCIVAEPLTTELPSALIHGTHVMYFHSKDECVEICKDLLGNAQKRMELGNNARKYYEEFVDPEVNMKRIIDIMLNGN